MFKSQKPKNEHKRFRLIAYPVLAAIVVVAGASLVTPHIGQSFTDTNKTPPQGNVEAPLNIGPDDQWKEGSLGVGTDSFPQATLDVGGNMNIRAGEGIVTTDDVFVRNAKPVNGSKLLTDLLQANTGTPPLDVVLNEGNISGGTQINMQNTKIVNVAPPTNPADVATKSYVDSLVEKGKVDTFNFENKNNVKSNTKVTSNRETITGIGGPFPISISGVGNPQYRIGNGNWTSSQGEIRNGQSLQLRVNSANAGKSRTVTVDIAEKADNWTVTSERVRVDRFNFENKNNVKPNTKVTSNRKSITGSGGPFSISIRGQGNPQYRIGNGNWTSSQGEIRNGQSLQLRVNSPNVGKTNSVNISVGNRIDSWAVSSQQAEVDDFDFNSIKRSYITDNNLQENEWRSERERITGVGGPFTLKEINSGGGSSLQARVCYFFYCTEWQYINTQTIEVQSGAEVQLRAFFDQARESRRLDVSPSEAADIFQIRIEDKEDTWQVG